MSFAVATRTAHRSSAVGPSEGGARAAPPTRTVTARAPSPPRVRIPPRTPRPVGDVRVGNRRGYAPDRPCRSAPSPPRRTWRPICAAPSRAPSTAVGRAAMTRQLRPSTRRDPNHQRGHGRRRGASRCVAVCRSGGVRTRDVTVASFGDDARFRASGIVRGARADWRWRPPRSPGSWWRRRARAGNRTDAAWTTARAARKASRVYLSRGNASGNRRTSAADGRRAPASARDSHASTRSPAWVASSLCRARGGERRGGGCAPRGGCARRTARKGGVRRGVAERRLADEERRERPLGVRIRGEAIDGGARAGEGTTSAASRGGRRRPRRRSTRPGPWRRSRDRPPSTCEYTPEGENRPPLAVNQRAKARSKAVGNEDEDEDQDGSNPKPRGGRPPREKTPTPSETSSAKTRTRTPTSRMRETRRTRERRAHGD